MAIASFYYPELTEFDESVVLSSEESAHAIQSRRLKVNQQVQLLNGQGRVAAGQIIEVDRRQVLVQINSTRLCKKPLSALTIATAIPKGDRQRVLVDMLSQIGVGKIVPLVCEHSVTHYQPKVQKKWQRWAIEACKQSQNPWLPTIAEGIGVAELLTPGVEAELFYADAEGSSMKKSHQVGNNTIVMIGPEGGFANTELKLFDDHQVAAVSLGTHVLRTEAAAVAAASQWMGYNASKNLHGA